MRCTFHLHEVNKAKSVYTYIQYICIYIYNCYIYIYNGYIYIYMYITVPTRVNAVQCVFNRLMGFLLPRLNRGQAIFVST